ncbi:MAG: methyltransferase domain-containing protein [Chloroflexi bacterium]|nr:methyltransferase domain-containing protein [Chloroflexota bacterium]
MKNSHLLHILCCPHCGGELELNAEGLRCLQCSHFVPVSGDGIPLFTSPPAELRPAEKQVRSPDVGTPWRKANWRFLTEQLKKLPADALILDAGAGRGDFAAAFEGRKVIYLEVYPYPEVDIVCDLTQTNPFRPATMDAIVLFNVLEHVYETHSFLAALSRLLKPGGKLLIAIPFMIKIHQEPLDFVRYTHYALERLGSDHGFKLEYLAGYYDPTSFIDEALGNIRYGRLRETSRWSRYLARLLLMSFIPGKLLLSRLLPSQIVPPQKTFSRAPTGYFVVYAKP